MTICALDLATTTGYASSASGVVMSGTFKCRKSTKEPWGVCFLRFKRWLREWLIQEKPEQLWYEDVEFPWRGVHAAKVYCGLRAVMLMECEAHGIEVIGAAVGTIKKSFTGKGNATKQDMIDAACVKYGNHITDDNEADAIAILELAIINNKCTPPTTRPLKKSSSAIASQVPT